MSKAVGVLGVNQSWDEKPYRHITKLEADGKVQFGKMRVVATRLVQEIAQPDTDGPLGIGNAVPFSRVANPIVAPSKLHYEIPRAGDRGLEARHRRTLFDPSKRLSDEIRDLTWLSGSTPKAKDVRAQD